MRAEAKATIKTTLATMTPERVEAYYRDGYLTMGPIVTPEDLDELDAYVTEMIRNLSEGKRPEHLDMPHVNDPYLQSFLMKDCFLDLVEPILGPHIVLFASHFICKPKGNGRPVPWHQDSGYWQHLVMPRKVVTIWLAVDETTPENGCMRVIPGSQHIRNERYDPVNPEEHVFSSKLPEDLYDESKAVDLILPRGHASFHDGWTIHGSNANNSDKRRCGYTMRYFAVEQETLAKEHPLFLARGVDTKGKNVYRNA